MNRFELTRLWQKTLAPQLTPDRFENERAILRLEFEKFREKAKILSAEISKDLPEFTVHDISHIDALWEMADLVTDDNFILSPTEAFVLGSAFLIHDLGMGLAAYPGGINELKKGTSWNDRVVYYHQKIYDKMPSHEEIEKPDAKIEKIVISEILRLMHAKRAESLTLISWKINNLDYFLIENVDLRDSYGKIIGLIAHSHWWNNKDLPNKFPQILGAPGFFPKEWEVDPLKLACLLRVADAIHLDERRAQGFLWAIRKPQNYANHHWTFQNKLYQPRVEKEKLIYTSKSPFAINDAESWWLCYDILSSVNVELQEVDSLLATYDKAQLSVNGVASIEDPIRFSKLITIEDWVPLDTKLKVGDVNSLVERLGGEELYGKNYLVPIRELIQNSCDAIKARRSLENEPNDWGEIVIKFGKEDDKMFFEIEDNGVGMSPKTLTTSLLDFGNSFWKSSEINIEYPGLQSKGYKSIGKYGIGFFSIFMLGDRVQIISRKYEESRDNTWCLEFSNGTHSRAVLRKAFDGECKKDGGTRIKIWLKDIEIYSKILTTFSIGVDNWTLADVLEHLCPALEVDLYLLSESNKKTKVLSANDWLTIDNNRFVKRVLGKSAYTMIKKYESKIFQDIIDRIQIIKNNEDQIEGRGHLFGDFPHFSRFYYIDLKGVITIGGFSTSYIRGFLGLLNGIPLRAARDMAMPSIDIECLKKILLEQGVAIITDPNIESEIKLRCIEILQKFECEIKDLPIAYYKEQFISFNEIIDTLKSIKDKVYLIPIMHVFSYIKKYKSDIKLNDNVFAIEFGNRSLLSSVTGDSFYHKYPECEPIIIAKKYWWYKNCICSLFERALSQAWETDISSILLNSHRNERLDERNVIEIGEINGMKISEFGNVYFRPTSVKSSKDCHLKPC